MANAIDAVKFAPDEAFDAKKMQTLTEATKEGLDLYRAEINQLERGKVAFTDLGTLDSAMPSSAEVGEAGNGFVTFIDADGVKKFGFQHNGELTLFLTA